MTTLVDVVQTERLARGWSVRRASMAGGISNTHWGDFEAGRQPISDKVRIAVSTAFGWDEHWPADHADIDVMLAELDAAMVTLAGAREQVLSLRRRLRALGASVSKQRV